MRIYRTQQRRLIIYAVAAIFLWNSTTKRLEPWTREQKKEPPDGEV